MQTIRELNLDRVIADLKRSKVNNKIFIRCGNTSYLVKVSVTAKVIAHNPKCAICGAAATKVFLCKSEDKGNYSLCFYTEKNGKLILLTKDHIIPRSQGGGNGMSNLQPCCQACNVTKADTIIDNPQESEQIVILTKELNELKKENKLLKRRISWIEEINERYSTLLNKLLKLWPINFIVKRLYKRIVVKGRN